MSHAQTLNQSNINIVSELQSLREENRRLKLRMDHLEAKVKPDEVILPERVMKEIEVAEEEFKRGDFVVFESIEAMSKELNS